MPSSLRDLLSSDGFRSLPPPPRHPGSRHRPNNEKKDPVTAPPRRSRTPLRFLPCRTAPAEPPAPSRPNPDRTLDRAILTLSRSRSLAECESAVRTIAKAWLEPSGPGSVSSPAVTEGLLEVLLASTDESVLELAVSLMADLISTNEHNRKTVLTADPNLEAFYKLLKTRNLYLKAAVLMYLLKPRAKNLGFFDWIPLIFRVLEEGDKRIRLFSVQCRPRSAAFYLLEQILVRSDKRGKNSRQVVGMGGLDMLISRFEEGDERLACSSGFLVAACVRADEICVDFVGRRLRLAVLVEILAGSRVGSRDCALALLVELVSRSRRMKVRGLLDELKNAGSINAMHVLLVYLQKAPAEQRPLAASILLQIDLLLGDPMQHSLHREEAIDALREAMDRSSGRKIQESCSRAILLLCSRFSTNGEALTELWLLMKAGFGSIDEIICPQDEEEAEMEDWRRRFSSIFIRKGGDRFSASLSKCLTGGISSLARSCLVMVAWMSMSISSSSHKSPHFILAWSPLVPTLLDCLSRDRAEEERILAAFSIRNISQNHDLLSRVLPLDRRSAALLHDLADVTWAARDLLVASDSANQRKL